MRVKRTDFHLPTAEHSSQPVIARLGAKKLSKFRHLPSSTFHLPRLWRSLTATRRRRVASGALSALIVGTIILQALPAGAAPATVRQEINIINKTYTATNTALTSDEIVQLDTTAYSGTVSYYFEVVANTTAASTGNIALRRSGTSTNDATIALSTVGTSYTRYRTSAFTAPAGQTQYVLYADAAGASKTLNIKAARIIISQTSDPITATETQIEIGNHETGKNNTTAAPLNNPKYWKYTAANWNPAPTFYAEVTYKATIGTVPQSQTFTSSGNWSAPAGVTDVTVQAWGGGGAGGSRSNGTPNGGAGGGGGGAFSTSTVNVTPSGNYAVSVGAGGIAATGNSNNNGGDGGTSTFPGDNLTVTANGGLGGTGGASGAGGAGGTGTFSGGAGATGSATVAGKGGGGAGSAGNGTAGSGQTGGGVGGSTEGGSGGDGGSNSSGTIGSPIGGGGGGGSRTSGGAKTGADGARGEVRLSWNEPASGHSVNVTLQEDNGSFSSWTDIANGTVVTAGTNNAPTRIRTSSGFAPTDGRHYRIVTSITNAGSTYDIYDAKIISQVSGSNLRFESQYLVANTSVGASTGLKDYDTLWNPSEWTNVVTSFYHESNGVSAGTAGIKLQSSPNTSPADVTASSLTNVGVVSRSGALTMPGSSTDIDTNVTATGTLNASRIIVLVDTDITVPPNTPTLSAPTNTATGVSSSPVFQIAATDNDNDYLRYRIEVCSTSNCSGIIRTIDQTSSQTGWSGQNTQTSTAYTSGTTATHTYQAPALTAGTQYWWRASAIDPGNRNQWSTASSIYSFTTNATPTAPTLSAPLNAATNVSRTPQLELSATDGDGDYLRYMIEVCDTANCSSVVRTIDQISSQTGWSGQNTQTSTAYTSGTTAIHNYQLSALSYSTQYWWRAYAKDPAGTDTWSAASSIFSFTTEAPAAASAKEIRGGVEIRGGTQIGQ